LEYVIIKTTVASATGIMPHTLVHLQCWVLGKCFLSHYDQPARYMQYHNTVFTG